MILFDTSIWIDHLRHGDSTATRLLHNDEVLMHPFVIGELAVGRLSPRATMLAYLSNLPLAPIADHNEVMVMIERFALFGRGIGYVDANLLASARLSPNTQLWTRDKRLQAAATELSLAANLDH